MPPKYKRTCPYCGETGEAYYPNNIICKCGAKYFCKTDIWAERKKKKVEPDLVAVVRCKDCRYWTKQKDSSQGRCDMYGKYPTGGWYCANGDRREQNEG